MNINARLSRSNFNLNHKQTPHFHRSYHNLNALEQQFPPPRPPAAEAAIEPQYEQQQQINYGYFVPAAQLYQQQQNQWFHNNSNNNVNRNWNKYETPNFVPASFWMSSERFVYPSMKPDTSNAQTWQPLQQQQQQQQQQEKPLQRGNILDYKNQSNTIYSVYNHNVKRHKEGTTAAAKMVTNNVGKNVVTTTIQPVIKVRTNVQGLPYTPQPERRNTVSEQRAIQAVMPLNDTFTNTHQQTS